MRKGRLGMLGSTHQKLLILAVGSLVQEVLF
jgi:hypothetical protein